MYNFTQPALAVDCSLQTTEKCPPVLAPVAEAAADLLTVKHQCRMMDLKKNAL
jgi:hypothetical protein